MRLPYPKDQQLSAKHKRPAYGFTLIELLVVISIIAVIAAILFPVFARAREKARQSSCASNLKQIALAFVQYKQDYDERLPHAWDVDPADFGVKPPPSTQDRPSYVTTAGDDSIVWPAKIEPYLKNRQVYSCPSVNKMRSSPCVSIHPSYAAHGHGWDSSQPVVGTAISTTMYRGASQAAYGYNVQYLGGGQYFGIQSCHHVQAPSSSQCYTCGRGAHSSDIAKPAQTVLLIDNTYANMVSGHAPAFANILGPNDAEGEFWCRANGTTGDHYDSFDPRHTGGLNVAFLDGHVKWMRKEAAIYRPFSAGACYQMDDYPNDENFLWDRF